MDIFNAAPDPFGGMVVSGEDLPEDSGVFAVQLASALADWRRNGVKVVWLTIPRLRASLIPAAVAAGFVFHHAREDSLLLTLALVQGAHVPPFATHYVGAGGVVLREDGQILVVSERYKLLPGRRLKLPGGALQAGEHIGDAVVREVKEETGVDARFEAVVCLRHWHGYRYGKSDIYFVCRLAPLTTELDPDPEEIAECLWMPHGEFLSDPEVHPFNKRIVRAALESAGLSREFLDNYGTGESHELLFPEKIPAAEGRGRG